MISQLSHLKLEKGSILVIQSDYADRNTILEMQKEFKKLDLGFKVPVLIISEDAEVSVAQKDEVIRQLDSITELTDGDS